MCSTQILKAKGLDVLGEYYRREGGAILLLGEGMGKYNFIRIL